MISVFEAANSLEAHMILNLLEQEGIHGRIDGEYLQGGIGELQVIGLVRVMVEEADMTLARAVIGTWESQQIEAAPEATHARFPCASAFVLGAVLGGLAVYVLCRT